MAGIVWEAMKGVLRNDGFELAGYIAFNTLLALVIAQPGLRHRLIG